MLFLISYKEIQILEREIIIHRYRTLLLTSAISIDI